MKKVLVFTDLDKANAYVTEINAAYDAQAEEAKASNDKVKLIEKDLAVSKGETETANANTEKALAEVEKANKSTEDALAEVETLSAKLDLQEKHKGDNIVTINKKSYKLIGTRFITSAGETNAEEAAKDKKFLAHLLEIGSGALVALD